MTKVLRGERLQALDQCQYLRIYAYVNIDTFAIVDVKAMKIVIQDL